MHMTHRDSLWRPALGLLMTLLCLAGRPAWADQAVPLDPRQAAALWKDGRWLAFQAAMKAGLDMRCEMPPNSATLAREIAPVTGSLRAMPPAGNPDWRSRHHELLLSCSGQQGLRALRVRAEFLPLAFEPINLELGVLFER